MSMRSGWTINGKHFTQCQSLRMGSPHFHCAIDGKRVSFSTFDREYKAAKAAKAAEAAEEAKKKAGA